MNAPALVKTRHLAHLQLERHPRESAFSSQNFDRPIHLGKDLENRIAAFVLGNGGVSARFEMTGDMPTLIFLSSDGIERRTSLGGSAAGWHAALDEMAHLYDEDICAGLHRTLRVANQSAQGETAEAELLNIAA